MSCAMAGELTRHGRPHKACGTTLKYAKSSSCVFCHKQRMRMSARGKEITDQLLDDLDAKLLDFPSRTVRIERKCRLPLLLEIPDPPKTIINVQWK